MNKYSYQSKNISKQVLINEIAGNISNNDFYVILHSGNINVVFDNALNASELGILSNVIQQHDGTKDNMNRLCAMDSTQSNTTSNVFVTKAEFDSDYFNADRMCKIEWFYTSSHQGGNISTRVIMNNSYTVHSMDDTSTPINTEKDFHGFNIVTIPKGINNISLEYKSLNGQITEIKNSRVVVQDFF